MCDWWCWWLILNYCFFVLINYIRWIKDLRDMWDEMGKVVGLGETVKPKRGRNKETLGENFWLAFWESWRWASLRNWMVLPRWSPQFTVMYQILKLTAYTGPWCLDSYLRQSAVVSFENFDEVDVSWTTERWLVFHCIQFNIMQGYYRRY